MLKDYKIIKVSNLLVYSLERLQIFVDDENLLICNTVENENIIIKYNNNFYLVENARMLFADNYNICVLKYEYTEPNNDLLNKSSATKLLKNITNKMNILIKISNIIG